MKHRHIFSIVLVVVFALFVFERFMPSGGAPQAKSARLTTEIISPTEEVIASLEHLVIKHAAGLVIIDWFLTDEQLIHTDSEFMIQRSLNLPEKGVFNCFEVDYRQNFFLVGESKLVKLLEDGTVDSSFSPEFTDFKEPVDIGLFSSGHIAVLDMDGKRLVQVDKNGGLVRTIELEPPAVGLTAQSNRAYLTDGSENVSIYKIDHPDYILEASDGYAFPGTKLIDFESFSLHKYSLAAESANKVYRIKFFYNFRERPVKVTFAIKEVPFDVSSIKSIHTQYHALGLVLVVLTKEGKLYSKLIQKDHPEHSPIAVFNSFKERLLARDIEGALEYVLSSKREKIRAKVKQKGLAEVIADLKKYGRLKVAEYGRFGSRYEVSRTDASDLEIYFYREAKTGAWRLTNF